MRDMALSLEDIVAPLTRAHFFDEYWGQNFLHLPGPAARFSPLLDWDALNAILQWHSPSQQTLKLYRDGQQMDPKSYIEPRGGQNLLNVGGLIAHLSRGATLVMDDVQSLAPRIAQLAAALRETFQTPNMVNLYAGSGRTNGFKLHWDEQEVFILQLSGRKHWKIFPPTRSHPLKEELDPAAEPAGPPAWEGVVEEGDMLYVPRGWWHVVHAMDEPSLHLNIGVVPPNGGDFLRWWVPRILMHDLARRNLPQDADTAARSGYLADMIRTMQEDGAAHDRMAEFLREWTAYLRATPSVRLPQALIEQTAPLGLATRVRLSQRNAICITRAPGESMAKFDSPAGIYRVSPQIVPALERLSGLQSIAVRDLCRDIQDPATVKALMTALDMMAEAGLVLKEEAEPGLQAALRAIN